MPPARNMTSESAASTSSKVKPGCAGRLSRGTVFGINIGFHGAMRFLSITLHEPGVDPDTIEFRKLKTFASAEFRVFHRSTHRDTLRRYGEFCLTEDESGLMHELGPGRFHGAQHAGITLGRMREPRHLIKGHA